MLFSQMIILVQHGMLDQQPMASHKNKLNVVNCTDLNVLKVIIF